MGVKDEDLKLQLNSNGGLVKINILPEPSNSIRNTPLKFSDRSKDFIDSLKRKFNHPAWLSFSKGQSVNTTQTMFSGSQEPII